MVPDVLSRAMAPHLTQLSRELRRARRGVPRGVHQARVASRRLREGLGALETVLPDDTRRRAERALRRIARALGAVRECDVTLALAAANAKGHEWPGTAVAEVTRTLQVDRKRRHEQLLDLFAEDRWRRPLTQLRRHLPRVENVEARRQMVDAASARRRRQARSLAKELHTLSALYVPDQLHAVRLASKKLRYALEWEQQIGRKAWVRERRVLEAAQEELGEWHDTLVLLERLHRLRRTGDYPKGLLGDFKQMAIQLERDCRARHAAVMARVPALSRVASETAR
jgi:CHAD domain-containing protein